MFAETLSCCCSFCCCFRSLCSAACLSTVSMCLFGSQRLSSRCSGSAALLLLQLAFVSRMCNPDHAWSRFRGRARTLYVCGMKEAREVDRILSVPSDFQDAQDAEVWCLQIARWGQHIESLVSRPCFHVDVLPVKDIVGLVVAGTTGQPPSTFFWDC